MLRSLGLSLAFVVPHLAVLAGDEDARASESEEVEEVEVPGRSEPEGRIPDPTASRARIEKERIVRAKERGDGIGPLVDTVAGVRVLDLGGPMGARLLTVRGGSPDQALVLVDGVPERTPFSTGFDVGQLALDGIESLELVRGGAGAALGEGALSGALLVTTKRASEIPEESLLLSYGAWGTTRISAAASQRPVAVAASFERTEGNFSYVSRLPGLPDVLLVRKNNDAARGAVSVRADTQADGAEISVAGGAALREAGVPGLETQADLTARERRGSARVRTSIVKRMGATDALEGAVSLSGLDIDYTDRDPTGLRAVHSSTRFLSAEGDASAAGRIGEAQLLRIAASAGAEQSWSTEHGTPNRFRGRASFSDEIYAGGDVTVFGALAAEAITRESPALLPRIGVRYDPMPAVGLRAAVGRSFRAPSIDALYHPSEAGFAGNPDLRAETAWEAEAALALSPEEWPEVAFTVFARKTSDVILYVNDDAFVIRPRNEGDARAAGGEVELTYRRRLGPVRASVDASGGLLLSELLATGRELPTQPRWSGAGELVLEAGPFALTSALRALSPTTANLHGTLEVGRYLRFDEVVSWHLAGGAAATLSVLNVLDDRALESVYKLPLPGRTVFLSVRVAS